MQLIQNELIAVYDFDVIDLEEPFRFRLEIHRCEDIFKGTVFRLERFRLLATFPQNADGNPAGILDDALLYVRDAFIDDRGLVGTTKDEVITRFKTALQTIFDFPRPSK